MRDARIRLTGLDGATRYNLLVVVFLVGCAGAPFDTVDFRRADPPPITEDLRLEPADVDRVSHTLELDLGAALLQPSGMYASDATLVLWTEYRGGLPGRELLCRQRVEIQGAITQGQGVAETDCAACTAELLFDPDTALDVSDPTVDPRECAAGSLVEVDVGLPLLTPTSVGGLGDVLHMLLLDAASLAADGWSPALDGSIDAASVTLELANQGFRFMGFLLVAADSGSLASSSRMQGLAAPLGADEPWYGLFSLAQPQDTPPDPLLEGWLAGSGLWDLPLARR